MTNFHDDEDELIVATHPVHPGLVLKLEVLPARKTRAVALAEAIGAARPGITRVLNGKAPVTPALALRIERAIGYSAELLVTMQGAYDLAVERQANAERLAQIQRIAA